MSFANSELKEIANYFAIPLDSDIQYPQASTLGNNVRNYFTKAGDFTVDNAFRFGNENPTRIIALRKYLQQLVDDGYLSQQNALQSLRAATSGAVMFYEKETSLVTSGNRDPTDATTDASIQNNQPASSRNTLSERSDALTRLSNLQARETEAQRTMQEERKRELEVALQAEIARLNRSINRITTKFDNQIGELSIRQFSQELTNVLLQLNALETKIDARAESIQTDMDNLMLKVLSQVNRVIAASKKQMETFAANELRLFRDQSDLRARVEKIESAVSDGEVETLSPETSPNETRVLDQATSAVESEKDLQALAITTQQQTPPKKQDFKSLHASTKSTTELGVGWNLQQIDQNGFTFKSTAPTLSAKVRGQRDHAFTELDLSGFAGSSSISEESGQVDFRSSGFQASLSGGYVRGQFDPSILAGRETRAGLAYTYSQISDGVSGSSDSSDTSIFLEHTSGSSGIATRHRLSTSPESVDQYVNYLFSTLFSLSTSSHISLGFGWMKDHTTDSNSRGVSVQYVQVLDD